MARIQQFESKPQANEYFIAPVKHLVTFHPRLFTAGLGDSASSYQGPPSASKQAAWNALYRSTLRIPRSSATKLKNKTVPIPRSAETTSGDDGFVIGLMVFHNLHCLHFISEALDVLHYPAQYGLNASFNPFDGVHTKSDFAKQENLPNSFLDVLHTEHCIDLLRQALMCNADITPYVFQEVEEGSGLIGTSVSTVHMCADFTALRDWAGEHIYDGELMGANVSRSLGECGPKDNGCGEEFGQREWRAANTWMDSSRWINVNGGAEKHML